MDEIRRDAESGNVGAKRYLKALESMTDEDRKIVLETAAELARVYAKVSPGKKFYDDPFYRSICEHFSARILWKLARFYEQQH